MAINGLPELPTATKQYDKWYVIAGTAPMRPVQVFQVQVNLMLQELLEAGDDANQVIDHYMESMREDAVKTWEQHRAQLRETENPVVQQIKDSIAAFALEGEK